MKKITLLTCAALATVGSSVALDWKTSNKVIEDTSILDLDQPFSVGVQTRADDEFGYALSSGDYNGDGYSDLAVGIPRFDVGVFGFVADDAGAVLVVFGSANGLTNQSRLLFQDLANDEVEENDLFGRTLVTGDFNGDEIDDLVVGVPFEDVFPLAQILNAGEVNIFYGSTNDFGDDYTAIHAGTGSQSEAGVEPNDQFATSLAVGDFDDDGFDDLAVGVPFEDFGPDNDINNVGTVMVYYGTAGGLTVDGRDVISQNSASIMENSEAGDLFGWSLAVGDFDNDEIDDLAIGVPREGFNGESSAGIVQIIEGSASGLSNNDYIRSQEGPINGIVEAGDEFGHSLAAGDINNDGISDLVVGVWKEDANNQGLINSGGINVLYGSGTGLSEDGDQFIAQTNSAVIGTGANTDQFGETVYVADLNYDGFDDVIVGSPNDIGFDGGGMVGNAGGINILYGSASGVSLSGDEYRPTSHLNDQYGHALTVAFFGEYVQLVVGIPGWESVDGDVEAGAVEVIDFTLPDLIFKDGFGVLF